jgi:hypothetical protein
MSFYKSVVAIRSLVFALSAVISFAATAVPVRWTLNNVVVSGGGNEPLSGSFVYDADINLYSAINITSTAAGIGPFTFGYPAFLNSATNFGAFKDPALIKPQNITFSTNAKTNAGGVLVLNSAANASNLWICNADSCTAINDLVGTTRGLTGSISGVVIPAVPVSATAIPTLSQWALMLLSLLMLTAAAQLQTSRKAGV